MTTYYLAVQSSRILADADRSPLADINGSITDFLRGKIILATELGLNTRDTQDAAYRLDWRNVTDGGSFAAVAATGEVKWSTSTGCGVADGGAVTKAMLTCTNLDSTMTWQNGLFNLGDNLAPDSGTYVTAADIYTEFNWALDFADSLWGHQYEFRVFNTTANASAGTCVAKVTIASGRTAAISGTATAVTAEVSAKNAIAGSITAATANTTAAVVGKAAISSTITAGLAPVTAAAEVVLTPLGVSGNIDATLASVTAAAGSTVAISGSVGADLSPATGEVIGELAISGTIAAMINQLTAGVVAKAAISGDIAAALAAITGSVSATAISTDIKTINSVVIANCKSINGLPIADMKTWNGLE